MAERFTRNSRDGRRHTVYNPTDQLGASHTHLKIETYYSKGGSNVWHGTQEPRGYWLSLGAVEVKPREPGDAVGWISETISLGPDGFGRRIFLLDAKAFHAKKFAEVIAALAPHIDALIPVALARDYHGVKALALAALGLKAAA